jgi:hypothetical protein
MVYTPVTTSSSSETSAAVPLGPDRPDAGAQALPLIQTAREWGHPERCRAQRYTGD